MFINGQYITDDEIYSKQNRSAEIVKTCRSLPNTVKQLAKLTTSVHATVCRSTWKSWKCSQCT